MEAEHFLLETDPSGNVKNLPKFPPNKQIECIFRIVDDVSSSRREKQKPHPDLAGQVEIIGDVFESASVEDWDILK